MEYRVEQLAAACNVSVDTIRYYQSGGLLPPPRRAGRVGIYDAEHRQRVDRIRALQHKGLTLAVIRRVLDGRLDRADVDLASAVAAAQTAGGEAADGLTLEDVATRSGVPSALLRAMERAGFALGRKVDGIEHYSESDIEVVRHGLALLEAGLPLDDLLALAADYNDAARAVAERAVEMFARHLRDPVLATAGSEEEAADRLVTAFHELLPAVTALVSEHFRRALLDVASEHLQRLGGETGPVADSTIGPTPAATPPRRASSGGAH